VDKNLPSAGWKSNIAVCVCVCVTSPQPLLGSSQRADILQSDDGGDELYAGRFDARVKSNGVFKTIE